MPERKRFPHIDLLESFAIFCVVFCHSTFYKYDFLQDGSFLNYFKYFLRTVLSPCIPLFFFANGYLLFNREFDLKKHIRKTLRFVILFFVWGLILTPLYMLISGEPLSVKKIVYAVLYMDMEWQMNVFWFLGAMVCLYVLFPALKSLFDNNRKAFVFFIAACAILTFGFVLGNQIRSALSVITHINLRDLYVPGFIMFNPFHGAYGYSYVYFCIGGLIRAYEDRILAIRRPVRNIVSSAGLAVSCALLFLVGVYYSKHGTGEVWDVVWNGFDTVFTFANVIFIYVLSLNYKKDRAFIRSISLNTLGIYLTHYLLINATRPWILKHSSLCILPLNVVYSFLIVCICMLFCLLLRKIPLLKKLV